jgi:hypothetical protein
LSSGSTLGTVAASKHQRDMNLKPNLRPRFALAVSLLAFVLPAAAAELLAKTTAKAPPAALDPAIRSLLAPEAVQVTDGGATLFEFWFCAEVPAGAKPESATKALDALKPITLVGAVAVIGKQHRTYRDTELPEGLYTMRFSLQPQDGDHLGTADFPYFLVLVPAKLDPKPDAFANYTQLVKASGREAPGGHPFILSLRPTSEGETPKLLEPAPEHKSVRVKAMLKPVGAAQPVPAIFEVVVKGKGKA